MDDRDRRTERRDVRSADPSLSPQANRILTEELREVTGRDAVEVPADRPRTDRGRHGDRPRLLVAFESNRLALGMTFLGALVVGAVISLATGSWWFLLLALAVHAVATIAVVVLLLQLTTETEHLSPTAAAQLEEEGVGDPDKLFGDLVHEFAPEDEAVDQRTAQTPSPHRGRPVGPS